MRKSEITRNTLETRIGLSLDLDGRGESVIDTGIGFLDHMLTLFSKHGHFDLNIKCEGDLNVDAHHTTEDIGIALGSAFKEALGSKAGIARYGFFVLPMDEALILTSVDFSGRSCLNYELKIPTEKVGGFDTELVEEFFLAFTRSAACTLHILQMAGKNSHHIIEGAFKSAGKSIRSAVAAEPGFEDEVPSTKGVLE